MLSDNPAKIETLALHYAMEIGGHLKNIQTNLDYAVRRKDGDSASARFDCRAAKAECRKLIQAIEMLEHLFAKQEAQKPLKLVQNG